MKTDKAKTNFYTRAILQQGVWKRVGINAQLNEKHRHAPDDNFVITAELMGYVGDDGSFYYYKTRLHINKYELKSDGSVDLGPGLRWAMNRIDSTSGNDVLRIKYGDSIPENVVDFETERNKRARNPSEYVPTKMQLVAFFELVREGCRVYFEDGKKVTGLTAFQ